MALGWKGQYTRYKGYFLNITEVYKRRADFRMFLEVILSLSTVIIFLLFALKPTVITIIGLVKEINEKKTTVATLNQKIQDLSAARVLYNQQVQSVPTIEAAVPMNPDVQVLVGQVQGIAAKDSSNLLSFSIGEITIIGPSQKKKSSSKDNPLPGEAREIPVSISISGDYPNLVNFITDLENFRRSIKIDNLTISSSESDKGKTIVLIINGRFPYLGTN